MRGKIVVFTTKLLMVSLPDLTEVSLTVYQMEEQPATELIHRM